MKGSAPVTVSITAYDPSTLLAGGVTLKDQLDEMPDFA